MNLAVPAVAFDLPAALPWVGPAAALIVAMGAANLYGEEGTALWLTRMVPGTERADVRGRQAAWLLVVAPVTVVLTAALGGSAVSGRGWAWPYVLALVPATLGGTAGLMIVLSVPRPVRQKDPHRRAGPFDAGEGPNAAGALIGRQYLLLALAAACTVPAAILVLLGTLRHQPLPQAAGVLAGSATGCCCAGGAAGPPPGTCPTAAPSCWTCSTSAPRALPGGQAAGPAREPAPELSRTRAAARGALLTVGILCIVPQGLVPIGFNLFGVDPQVKVWFAARYLPQRLQVPAAAAFIAIGALAIWAAATIQRKSTGER